MLIAKILNPSLGSIIKLSLESPIMILCESKNRVSAWAVVRWCFAALLLVVLLSQPSNSLGVQAAEISDDEDYTDIVVPVQDVEPEIHVPGFGGVNASHKYLSSGVERVAQRIDSFFGEDRIYEEATRTYLQARGSVIYGRGGEFEYDGKFRAKVDLPQLKRKANLVFESDDEGDSAEDFDRIASESKLGDELQDQDVSAALQIVLTEKERWNFSVRPGVRFSDSFDTFIKLRFRRNQPIGKKWLSRGTVEVGFYSERGWENEYNLDFERDVGSANFFRSTSTVLWREEFPGTQLLGQAFQLTHFIDRRQLVSFEVSTSAETRPNLHDVSYFSSIRYRRNIHRGWLFLELKPQVTWERVNDFEADPALVLSLEVLFGAKHL